MLGVETSTLLEKITNDLETKKRIHDLICSSVIGEYIQQQAEDARQRSSGSSIFFYGVLIDTVNTYHQGFTRAYERAAQKIIDRGNFSSEVALGVV